MKRRGIPSAINWYLPEWMSARNIKTQSEMMKLTGWSKATMSQLYTGKQDYSPTIINQAAKALNCFPYELLMLPERAMALRRLQEQAFAVVETTKQMEEDARTGTFG